MHCPDPAERLWPHLGQDVGGNDSAGTPCWRTVVVVMAFVAPCGGNERRVAATIGLDSDAKRAPHSGQKVFPGAVG